MQWNSIFCSPSTHEIFSFENEKNAMETYFLFPPPRNRATQSMIYVPLLLHRFHNFFLLIVQYKYLQSCSVDFIFQNLNLRTRSCGTGFVTEPSWLLHFHPTNMVGRKCFVPLRYQLRSGISRGPALKYFGIT